jgi:tetratricopeptide (TPR) repeat protein
MAVSSQKLVVILCLLLAAVTLAVYNPVVRNQFVDFDDQAYIIRNSHIQHGLNWQLVKWSVTTFYYGIWHPLTWLSHALDYQMFHLNPVGHHYSSVLLHAINAVLLFLLLQRATGAIWPSLFVGALFALHPINVESLAWAAERKNVLSTLFFLLAMHAYDRYGRSFRKYLYGLVILFFALGLMAKPQIVTLPFILLLWDYWPLQRIGGVSVGTSLPENSSSQTFGSLVLEKWPLFLLALADSVVTLISQREGNTVRTLVEVPLAIRLENVFLSYVKYLGKAFWPSHLVPLYPRPESLPPFWQAAGALAVILLITAFVISRRQHRYLLVGWFWFLGSLVPMIGLVTVGEQAMADRYAYVALIGLFIAVAWSFHDLKWRSDRGKLWLGAPAVIVLGIIAILTYRQVGFWRDSETLWSYTLSVTEGNYVAHNNFALALSEAGKSDEAVREFRAGMALHPYQPAQVVALALYELQVEHPREAIEEIHTALRLATDSATKAAALSELGQAYLQLGDYDAASGSFAQALRIQPENGMALMGTGLLSLHQKQYDLAVEHLMHAAKVDPSDMNALLLAEALRRAGRNQDADSIAAQVKKISPDLMQAQLATGRVLSFAGLKPI